MRKITFDHSHSLPTPAAEREKDSWVDRVLNFFTRVNPGEGAGALLLASNIFVLLGLYYLLKTVREALVLTEGGAEVKSYSSAGQAVLLLLAVPAYGRV